MSGDDPKGDEKPDRDTLLVEYQKAQDSAEHHDSLVWSVSSIVFGGMLVLIGFSLDHLADKSSELPVLCIGLLGILLTVSLWFFQSDLRSIKRKKYRRCIEIEKRLGMEQHSKLDHPEGRQTIIYKCILIAFALFWIFVLLKPGLPP